MIEEKDMTAAAPVALRDEDGAVREDYVERVYKRTLEIMSRPALFDEFQIDIEVPLMAEAKIGPWADGVTLDKWLKERRNSRVKEGA